MYSEIMAKLNVQKLKELENIVKHRGDEEGISDM